MSKILVIYYSRTGQNYVSGNIVNLEKGNTEILAEYIRDTVDSDLFKIETIEDYPDDYRQCVETAKLELQNDARPTLKKYLDDIADYDKIVVAGPCWFSTYPTAVFSLLERLDFSDKTVYPVMSHEGSGLAGSASALKKYCKGATVGEGLAVKGSLSKTSQKIVAEWAAKNLL